MPPEAAAAYSVLGLLGSIATPLIRPVSAPCKMPGVPLLPSWQGFQEQNLADVRRDLRDRQPIPQTPRATKSVDIKSVSRENTLLQVVNQGAFRVSGILIMFFALYRMPGRGRRTVSIEIRVRIFAMFTMHIFRIVGACPLQLSGNGTQRMRIKVICFRSGLMMRRGDRRRSCQGGCAQQKGRDHNEARARNRGKKCGFATSRFLSYGSDVQNRCSPSEHGVCTAGAKNGLNFTW